MAKIILEHLAANKDNNDTLLTQGLSKASLIQNRERALLEKEKLSITFITVAAPKSN